MTILAAPKLTGRNRLECFALYVLLQGVPFYSGVALVMKLINATEFVGEPFGAAIFIAMVSTFHALVTPWLGPRFPLFLQAQLRAAVRRSDAVVLGKSLALAGASEHAAQIAEQFAAAVSPGGRRGRPPVSPFTRSANYSERQVVGDSMIKAQIAA